MKISFRKQLKELINKNGMENNSNTPDFILAKFLDCCLTTFDTAVYERDKWYGFKPWEGNNIISENSGNKQREEK